MRRTCPGWPRGLRREPVFARRSEQCEAGRRAAGEFVEGIVLHVEIDLTLLAGDEIALGVEEGRDHGELLGAPAGAIDQLQVGDVQIEHDVHAGLTRGRSRGLGGKGQGHLVQSSGGEHFLIDSAFGRRRVGGIDGGEITGPRLHFIATALLQPDFQSVILTIGSAGRREGERVGVFRQKAEFAKAEIEIVVVLEEEAAGAGGEDGHVSLLAHCGRVR